MRCCGNCGALAAHKKQEEGQDRMMDSMDLEREKGITILAKNTAVKRGDTIINIIDNTSRPRRFRWRSRTRPGNGRRRYLCWSMHLKVHCRKHVSYCVKAPQKESSSYLAY
jgi:hypothetical protein